MTTGERESAIAGPDDGEVEAGTGADTTTGDAAATVGDDAMTGRDAGVGDAEATVGDDGGTAGGDATAGDGGASALMAGSGSVPAGSATTVVTEEPPPEAPTDVAAEGGVPVTAPEPEEPGGPGGNGGGDGEPLLRVVDLVKEFPVRGGLVRRQVGAVHAVSGISFDLRRHQTLGIVGESGCGKSTTGRLILNLIEPTAGSVLFDGRDVAELGRRRVFPGWPGVARALAALVAAGIVAALLGLVFGFKPWLFLVGVIGLIVAIGNVWPQKGAALRHLRCHMQIVFQDPYASLNPRMTVESIISEPMRVHGRYRAGGRERVKELMELVGLKPEHINRFPHEFSGGQRQRIGVARALSLDPDVLVLDEPVSALDVSIQAGVVNLLEELQDKLGLAYVFIAHDLAVVRHISDAVAVMYLGKIVEVGAADDVYERPGHPYTQALMSAVPVPDPRKQRERLRIILPGDPPSPVDPPTGCRFHTRCWHRRNLEESGTDTSVCVTDEPLLTIRPDRGVDHSVACHFAEVHEVV